jgi:hypothetical protein
MRSAPALKVLITLEVGGDDRHLGRGIQHTAQLVVGAAQRLLADLQLGSTLLDQARARWRWLNRL